MKKYNLPNSLNPCITMQKVIKSINEHIAVCFIHCETDLQFQKDVKRLKSVINSVFKSDTWKHEYDHLDKLYKDSLKRWYDSLE